jgi:hypothetical protein
MLHIIQVVLSGSAEIPMVFYDETAAHAAFAGCAKTYWAQSYAAYCERNGVSSESFSSAQDFVASFDLADRSRIHYWVVTPEDAGAAGLDHVLPGAAELLERREHVLRLARGVEEASGAVREGVAELLDAIAALSGDAAGGNEPPVPSVQGRHQPGRPAAAGLLSRLAPQPAGRKYDPGQRKAYVESIKNMSRGNRGEFHLFDRYAWRQAVYGNETDLEYWEWVAEKVDEHIEKAQHAGYAVIDDPDQPGHYRFRTPDGVVSDISTGAEGEAWCRAGLHLEGK